MAAAIKAPFPTLWEMVEYEQESDHAEPTEQQHARSYRHSSQANATQCCDCSILAVGTSVARPVIHAGVNRHENDEIDHHQTSQSHNLETQEKWDFRKPFVIDQGRPRRAKRIGVNAWNRVELKKVAGVEDATRCLIR